MVFHWSPCDSKFPQFSITFLSILADLHNVAVSMVSTRPFYFQVLQSLYQTFDDCTEL